MNVVWHLTALVCVVLPYAVLARPPSSAYLGESVAHVVEVSSGVKRSLTGERKFRVQYDDKTVELDLKPSPGLLPETLRVTVFGTDEGGKSTVEYWTHTTGQGNEVYVDLNNSASVLIDDDNGPAQMRGRIGADVIIEPTNQLLEKREIANHSVIASHIIYKVKPTQYPEASVQDITETIPEMTSASEQNEEKREKRQQINQIYVPLHLVINYDYYEMMGSSEAAVNAYIKTYFGSINSYFALITQPRVQISIQAVDIFKTKAAANLIEKHRHTTGGLIAGEVLDEFRKWAFDERPRIGENYAGIMIMTGTEYMCLVPHGNSKELCQDIAGLTVESAACDKFGDPFPGITYRVAIALDDYAYSGVMATTHEIGHMLGMSHDGEKSHYDPKAPNSEACSFYDYYIMGQQNYVKAHTKWSDCSLRQLQYWVQDSGRATCVTQPPAPSPLPFDETVLTVHDVNKQCQIRHGPNAIFPSFCQKVSPKNEEICYKLMCYDTVKKQCTFGYGAAPGTPCGPSGEICYQGACQMRPNLGITQAPPGPAPPVKQVCEDRSITLRGLSCRDWLSKNLPACDHPTITGNCCASRKALCTGKTTGDLSNDPAKPNNPDSSGPTDTGCTDTPGVTLGGQSCDKYLSGPAKSFACNWEVVTTHCCASKAKHCSGTSTGDKPNKPIPTNPPNPVNTVGPTEGCTDTPGVTLGGQSCDKYLSGPAKSFACNWEVVTTHCCASKAKHCSGTSTGGKPNNPIPTNPPNPVNTVPTNKGCTDTPGVTLGGQSCDQYLSGPSKSFACNWEVVTTHCCASKAKHCSGTNADGVIG